MAEEEDLGKFPRDLAEYMPIPTIRREMKEDEKLKFADSDKCTHIAFEEEEIVEDRDLEIFSDDLFKYVYIRRLDVEFRSPLKRTLEDPISNFHPHIGMSVLCCSYFNQRLFLLEFLQYELDIENLSSIALYFTRKVFSLYRTEFNIFKKLQVLASLTLELGAFFYLKGNRYAIYYSARLYFKAFFYIYKKDFFESGGWTAWKKFVAGDVKFYTENKCEVPIPGTDEIFVHGWLERFDRWIIQLSLKTCNQTESTLSDDESGNRSDNEKNLDDTVDFADDTLSEAEVERRCLLYKDCPLAKRLKAKRNHVILDLIEIINRRTADSAYEDIYQIIENDTYLKKLMRYCLFARMTDRLKKNPKVKVSNSDILQIMKLLLKDNSTLAVSCFNIVIQMSEELNKAKSFNKKVSEEQIPDMTAENRQETNSIVASFAHLAPVIESSTSIYQEHKKLLDSFLNEIIPNDQICTSPVEEICEILSNESKTEILLSSEAFRSLMNMTLIHTQNRWEDEWILSVMKSLINNSQGNIFMTLSTVDGAQNTEYFSNEVSTVVANPDATESLQSDVTETAQPPVPSVSDRKDTEPVFADTNAEPVENPLENMSSPNKCEQCYNCIKEKLKPDDEYCLATAAISIPENEANVKRKKKRLRRRRRNNKNSETSVDKETPTSETAVVDLPLTDLNSESTSTDIEQITEYEINNPDEENFE